MTKMNPTLAFWLANLLLFVHAAVVGVTVAGGVAIFTGRFAQRRAGDKFFWAFASSSIGQIASLVLTGGCFLTAWERQLRLIADPNVAYAKAFLEQYLPFLPADFVRAMPVLTLAALAGAAVQLIVARRNRRQFEATKRAPE